MITINTMKDFLEEYGYGSTDSGLKAIYNTWKTNKADLLEHFRKHPNWDEDNLAIVFKEEQYERPFEKNALYDFKTWVLTQIDNYVKENAIDIDTIEDDKNRIKDIISYENNIRNTVNKCDCKELFENIILNQNNVEYREMLRILTKKKDEILKDKDIFYFHSRDYALETEKIDKINKVRNALSYIKNHCDNQLISKEQADSLNELTGLNITEGLKLTKAILKICKILDLDKIVEMRHRNDNPDNEMKNYGWNYQFQLLADKINPVKYKRITVISLNPLDYWGMSFGYKWASCHTIDKRNKRNVPNHNYEGCYSAGTESYMLDESSVIFYVINEDYDGNTYWNEDKMQRVVFSMNKDKDIILQSRVYPDGRDGGDNSLSAQFRAVMQKVISQLYDLNNYWNIKKGTSNCNDWVESDGVHYRDYENYEDCNLSFNKDTKGYKYIRIGHNPICPACGCEHEREDNILCEDCEEDYYDYASIRCSRCGDRIEDDDYIEVDGNYYCCEICANNDGYCICVDDDEWYHEDDLFYCEDDCCYHNENNSYEDDYDGYRYSGSPEIETEDGNCYHNEENAFNDGYDYDDDGNWYHIEDLIEDNNGNRHYKNDCFETDDGKYYYYEDDAESDGYVKTVSGNWVKENNCRYDDYNDIYFTEEDAEVICEDGNYFYSRNSAVEAGYTEVNEKWLLTSEVSA